MGGGALCDQFTPSSRYSQTSRALANPSSFTPITMAAKRKASAMGTAVDDEPVDPSDELAFYCLGGGNEVGRSCHIIQYKGKTVMVNLDPDFFRKRKQADTLFSKLDAGMHPAKEGFSALPFFDEFDLSTVDVLLISQYVDFP